jgi:hypothetical protein
MIQYLWSEQQQQQQQPDGNMSLSISLSLSLSLLPNLQIVCESQPPTFVPFLSCFSGHLLSSALYMYGGGSGERLGNKLVFQFGNVHLGGFCFGWFLFYFTLKNCEFFFPFCLWGPKPICIMQCILIGTTL